MTDFVNLLEKTIETLKNELVTAGQKTIKLTEEAVVEGVKGLKVAVDEAGHGAEEISQKAYVTLSGLAKIAYEDLIRLRHEFTMILQALESTMRSGVKTAGELEQATIDALAKIENAVSSAIGSLRSDASSIESAVAAAARDAAVTLGDVVRTLISGAETTAEHIANTATTIVHVVSTSLEATVRDIGTGLETVFRDAMNALRVAVNALESTVVRVVEETGTAVDNAIDAGQRIAEDVADSAEAAIMVVRGAASDALGVGEDVVKAVEGLPGPMAAFSMAAPAAIAALAVGGILMVGFYIMAGELARPRPNRGASHQ